MLQNNNLTKNIEVNKKYNNDQCIIPINNESNYLSNKSKHNLNNITNVLVNDNNLCKQNNFNNKTNFNKPNNNNYLNNTKMTLKKDLSVIYL